MNDDTKTFLVSFLCATVLSIALGVGFGIGITKTVPHKINMSAIEDQFDRIQRSIDGAIAGMINAARGAIK